MALQEHICRDPRDPEGDACLTVGFDVSRFGKAPHGYGAHFDPGCGDEFDITSAADEAGADVIDTLTTEQIEALEVDIAAHFDFRAAERSERWDPREDF